ncbi:hypothetical protein CONPUDRAFT_157403 [Coniophora puteana RWD-64-598 SS2]|uniref:Uncharacterized protein n=1 Tax=Coniophora puteana (strain RWD-64-598) TaxID=741705 RepID=A0A5M3MEV3_CONPW|nr:uncharacterized protein CONPUDRAFT_157403 [Coniophora puteana RWD-64-598 SS2]EIW77135.1 hypothetical protein CONPUDRAFT_157403 [Coniophora puteana RWD-64-598 SS2]
MAPSAASQSIELWGDNDAPDQPLDAPSNDAQDILFEMETARSRSGSNFSMQSINFTATVPPLTASALTKDFKTEYQLRGRQKDKLETWDQFQHLSHVPPPVLGENEEPWKPFKSHKNAEFTLIAVEAKISQAHIDRLLALLKKTAVGNANVTFRNDAELRSTCDSAAEELTPVEKHDIKFEYKKEEIPAKNVFWKLTHGSDPHDTLSFDQLHFNHGGIFGRHILPELQKILKHVSKQRKSPGILSQFNNQFAQMPRWRDLNHFSGAVNTSFSDGNKFQDMLKQILFAAQNILMPDESPVGYALLQLTASYLKLDSWISLDVHTDAAIKAGEIELVKFNLLLDHYINIAEQSDVPDIKTDWDFPKAHYFKHTFEDIRNKGTSRNYSTQPNKGIHSYLKHHI